MINFEFWFFIQLINFLAILAFLYFFLFKPILNILRERADRIAASLKETKDLQKKSEEAMAELDREIAAAKEKARTLFQKYQKEGFDEQRRILEDAKKKSIDIMEKAKGELRQDTEKARVLLKEEAGRISLEIAKKILGRELQR